MSDPSLGEPRRTPGVVRRVLPPPEWRLPVTLVMGTLVGFTAFVFHVSRASSYLSDDPATCVNCHVMAPEYVTWANSAHGEVATCNDCHVPHDNYPPSMSSPVPRTKFPR